MHVGLLAVAGQAHIVEHLALELDAAAAAKGKGYGNSRSKAERPADKCYGWQVPQSSP